MFKFHTCSYLHAIIVALRFDNACVLYLYSDLSVEHFLTKHFFADTQYSIDCRYDCRLGCLLVLYRFEWLFTGAISI